MTKKSASPKIERWPSVVFRVGLCKQTIRNMIKKGSFPPKRTLGENSVGFHECEVDEWILSRGAEGHFAPGLWPAIARTNFAVTPDPVLPEFLRLTPPIPGKLVKSDSGVFVIEGDEWSEKEKEEARLHDERVTEENVKRFFVRAAQSSENWQADILRWADELKKGDGNA